MLNLVCGAAGDGQAVLVRAIIPTHGVDAIALRRAGQPERDWCRGPGRLALALAIGPEHDGARLDRTPFAIRPPAVVPEVLATPRVGISKAVDRPWRFLDAGAREAISGPRGWSGA